MATIGMGLVIGGAAGNLVDRIFRGDAWLRGAVVDFIDFRHDRYGAGRGMYSPLRFGGRDALHPVGAGLELQVSVDVAPLYPGDDLLVTAVFTRALG